VRRRVETNDPTISPSLREAIAKASHRGLVGEIELQHDGSDGYRVSTEHGFPIGFSRSVPHVHSLLRGFTAARDLFAPRPSDSGSIGGGR